MVMIYPTGEKYCCPNSLDALAVTFPSLQSKGRACGGVINNDPDSHVAICSLCDYYVTNTMEKDWAEMDKPISPK